MHGRTLALLAALALGYAACGPNTTKSVVIDNGGVLESGTSQTLLQLIMQAPTHVSWQGRRRVEVHAAGTGTPVDLSYEETVTTDGRGGFSVHAEDLVSPQLAPSSETLFLLTQDRREGFMFRHRDPMVRDEGLLLQNYTVTDTGEIVQILGRDCAHLVLQQVQGGGNTLHWYPDLATGVLLDAMEYDDAGALVMRAEYTSFALDPDTSNVVWHVNPVQENPLDLAIAKQVLGFTPKQPHVLPPGYHLALAQAVVDPTDQRKWARLTYTDGLNEFFLLDGGPGVAPPTPQNPLEADVMRFLSIGPWVAADGAIGGRRIIAMGRMSVTGLQQLVESSIH